MARDIAFRNVYGTGVMAQVIECKHDRCLLPSDTGQSGHSLSSRSERLGETSLSGLHWLAEVMHDPRPIYDLRVHLDQD